MALIHRAQLTPSKLELVQGWAPSQPWFAGDADGTFEQVASYRFDDPLGKVGLEVLFVRVDGGPVMQLALTYREAPFDPAESWLIGTMMHSVLGKRWVYDATGDPAFVAALATTILTGGVQAELMVDSEHGIQRGEPTARVRGTGNPGGPDVPADEIGAITTRETSDATIITASDVRIVLLRRPSDTPSGESESRSAELPEGSMLEGEWDGQPARVTLAYLA